MVIFIFLSYYKRLIIKGVIMSILKTAEVLTFITIISFGIHIFLIATSDEIKPSPRRELWEKITYVTTIVMMIIITPLILFI